MTASYHMASDHANKMIFVSLHVDWLDCPLSVSRFRVTFSWYCLQGQGQSATAIYGGKMAGEFESVEKSLEKHLPPKELAEVRRILYGKELK